MASEQIVRDDGRVIQREVPDQDEAEVVVGRVVSLSPLVVQLRGHKVRPIPAQNVIPVIGGYMALAQAGDRYGVLQQWEL